MKTSSYDIKDSIDGHQNNDEANNQVANACIQCFKVCCKKKASCGLEDIFWLLFLIMIIALSVIKSTMRIGWTQMIYMFIGSVLGLIVLYIIATLIYKFCFDDASTAHWNAHARFTQAAIQSRLQQEEHKVASHVIAPPRMGGAKLNIIYTVGDVPILGPQRGIISNALIQTPTEVTPPRVSPISATTSETSAAVQAKVINKNRSVGDFTPTYEVNDNRNNTQQSSTLIEEHDSEIENRF